MGCSVHGDRRSWQRPLSWFPRIHPKSCLHPAIHIHIHAQRRHCWCCSRRCSSSSSSSSSSPAVARSSIPLDRLADIPQTVCHPAGIAPSHPSNDWADTKADRPTAASSPPHHTSSSRAPAYPPSSCVSSVSASVCVSVSPEGKKAVIAAFLDAQLADTT